MRRSWPIVAALGLGLPLLGAFATGCHERGREVAYYGPYEEREVYAEPGYGYYPYGYYGGHYYRHEREHAFRDERERGFRHEREHREHHG